jgi:hypothetical protein
MPLPKLKTSLFAVPMAALVFISCQKDLKEGNARSKPFDSREATSKTAERAFKASFATWYRFHPLQQPSPIQIDGTDFLGILRVPGGGQGQVTHMGNALTYFNQTAYVKPPDFQNVVGSVAAPVMEVPSYQFTGAPLPLIQQGDFDGLPSVISALNIPATINGHIVSTVIFDKKMVDAFFVSVKSSSPISINGTTATTSGRSLIVGGTGKFIGAYGEMKHTIIFDTADPNKASYTLEGRVRY